jgi:hypothetical protein
MNKLKFAMTLSLALVATAIGANAQTQNVRNGITAVSLAPSFVSALTSLKVAPSPLGSSQLIGTTIDFPIVGGAFDPATVTTELIHSGGLRLTAGKTVVDLRDFIIDATSAQPTITGLVIADGQLVGRVPLFNLSISGKDVETADGFLVYIKDVGVTLTSGAASTLNSVFKTDALTGTTKIGTATVLAIASKE